MGGAGGGGGEGPFLIRGVLGRGGGGVGGGGGGGGNEPFLISVVLGIRVMVGTMSHS